MKKIIEEFKVFIMRGNVLDLAIGVIIGGAFQKIVNSLVNDVIMPLISLITGGINFSNWFLALDNSSYAVLAEAQANGANTLNYVLFQTEVLNFLIISFVIFMFVKTMNRIASKRKKVDVKEEAVKTKQCPYCKTEIDAQATRCPHCTSVLE